MSIEVIISITKFAEATTSMIHFIEVVTSMIYLIEVITSMIQVVEAVASMVKVVEVLTSIRHISRLYDWYQSLFNKHRISELLIVFLFQYLYKTDLVLLSVVARNISSFQFITR